MLSKKQIKLIRKNIKLFSDSTQNTFKKEYYCLYVDYIDGTSQKCSFKRLKSALKYLDTLMQGHKAREIYFTLQSINDAFEIAIYIDKKLEIL